MHYTGTGRIAALLALTLGGCLPKGSPDGETQDTCNNSCCGFVPESGTDEVTVPADAYTKAVGDDGVLSSEECLALCAQFDATYYFFDACQQEATAGDGGAILACSWTTMCEGRPALGLRRPRARGPNARARWFARAAWAERASIPAFTRLARELAAHGAPDELVVAARAAAADEARHTRMMSDLARSEGARASRPVASPMHVRPLFELAVENTVSGCVGETWAAAAALHQAATAGDERVRETMQSIAADEVGHAELAWAVDAWVRGRLTAEENTRLDDARRLAARRLVYVRYPRDVSLGLPGRSAARHIRRGLAELYA